MALLDAPWLTNNNCRMNRPSKDIANEHHHEIQDETTFEVQVQATRKLGPGENLLSFAAPEEPIIVAVDPEEVNSTPLSKPELVRTSHPLHDRRQRPLHVLIAGVGPSGIAMAIELMKLENVTFQIFEKNNDVGGTWLENRYPGAACDVASHAYQYTFEENTDWSHQ